MGTTKQVWHLIHNEGYSEEEAYARVEEEIDYHLPLDTKISNIINESFMHIEELQKQLNDYKYISSNITEKEIIEEVFNNSKYFYLSGLIISVENKDYNHLNQIFYQISSYLRNEGLKSYHIYYFIFYIFFFKKLSDELTDKPLSNIKKDNFDFSLAEALLEIEVSYKLEFNLSEELINIMKNISSDRIHEVFNILSSFDSTLYDSNIFVKYLSTFIKKSIIDVSGEYYSNHSLHRLMVKILNIKSHSKVFDPFGGSAELLLEFLYQKDSMIHYMDINRDIGLMAYMSFVMSNYKDFYVSIQNSFDSYGDGNLYDYIITEPPFRLRVNQVMLDMAHCEGVYGGKSRNNSTPYFLIYILSKLKNDGKAIILLPQSFFYERQKIRQYLLDNDLIEAIIDLPSNIIANTGVKTSLLLLNKSKTDNSKGKVKFINVELLIKQTQKQEAIIDVESALNGYNLDETKNSIVVDNEMIVNNDCNLNINRYKQEILELQNLIEDEKSKYLKDLATIILGKSINRDMDSFTTAGTPFIRIKDLKKDMIDIQLLSTDKFTRVNEKELKSSVKITEECILIARLINQLKPTIFKPTKDMPHIFIDQNVYALIVKKDIISIEYLYYQLYAKLLLEQIESYAGNSIYSMLNKRQLGELIIPYMSLELQHEFIVTQKSNIISQEKAQLQAKLDLIGSQEEIKAKESDIVRVLVHQLRATLLTMSMKSQTLQEIIKTNNIGHLTNINDNLNDFDDDFDKPTNYTLEDISDKLHEDSKKLSDSLSNVKKVMDFKLSKSDFSISNICTFFKNYIASKKIEIENKYEVRVKCNDINIEFNESSLTELLDQLLLNAEKHAFIEEKNYIIKFNIKVDKKKNILIIDYKNNGKKFLISKEEYIGAFVKGQSSQGSGIGGNYIYRIIKAHNGDLFIEEQDEGFHLKIEMPLKQKKEK